jgi:ribosomal protein S13
VASLRVRGQRTVAALAVSNPAVASLRVRGQRTVAALAVSNPAVASLRVRGQRIRQHCNARVPLLSTAGSSGSDVA